MCTQCKILKFSLASSQSFRAGISLLGRGKVSPNGFGVKSYKNLQTRNIKITIVSTIITRNNTILQWVKRN
jgi:hypothetical protein